MKENNIYCSDDYVQTDPHKRRDALHAFERQFWTESIKRTKGNLAKLARETGRSRERLYPKLRKLNLMHYVNAARPWKPEEQDLLKDIIQKTEGIINYREAKSLFETEIIYHALKAAEGNVKKTAKYLGDSEENMKKRIKKLGIEERLNKDLYEHIDTPTATSDVDRLREIICEIEKKKVDQEKTKKAA